MAKLKSHDATIHNLDPRTEEFLVAGNFHTSLSKRVVICRISNLKNNGQKIAPDQKDTIKVATAPRGGGGHFNFICTGGCGHRIGKLTHPQTKAGPKTDPFSDYLQ